MQSTIGCPIKLFDISLADVYVSLERADPQFVFGRIMNGDDETSPLEDITRSRLLDDASRAAAHLVKHGCRPREPGAQVNAIAFLATSGYLYYVYEVATFLLGWTPVLLSLKNSTPAFVHLLRTSKSQFVLVDEPHVQDLQVIFQDVPDIARIPMLDICDITQERYRRPSPMSQETSEGLDLPAIYHHTSGSTGLPKLIPLSHRYILAGMRGGTGDLFVRDALYGPLPLFHAIGTLLYIHWTLGSALVATFVHTAYPMTGKAVLSHIRRLPGCVALVPAALLEDISVMPPHDIQVLLSAKRVQYGGAPLRQTAGDILVRNKVPLVTNYGMTEIMGITTNEFPSSNIVEDWPYIRFNDVFDLRFLPVDDHSNLRELVAKARHNASPAVFNTDDFTFKTNDLWEPHPTKPGLWKHMGRKDSLIVLSNGQKTDAKQIESLMQADLNIARVVVFGNGRFLPGVILEPAVAVAASDESEFIDVIWPTVERLNSLVPKHSRLLREMILIQNPSKLFVLTEKHSIKNKETLALYAEEIDLAYANLEGGSTVAVPLPIRFDYETVVVFVEAVVTKISGLKLARDANLFQHGIDSLQAIAIRSSIVTAAMYNGASKGSVPFLIVYEHPTISELATSILSLPAGDLHSDVEIKESRIQRITSLLDKYSQDLPRRQTHLDTSQSSDSSTVFVLTGSTGSLGSHVLAALAGRDSVQKVYCFVRPAPVDVMMAKHRRAFESFGLDVSLLDAGSTSGRIVFLSADFSQDDFGLRPEILKQIHAEVTHIIHCAWQLNFNLDVTTFERHDLAGVHNIASFALKSPRRVPPTVTFVSSIAAALDSPEFVIHEIPMTDPSVVAFQTGYGQSKYVAERVLDNAARLGLPVHIVRCGQLSGNSRTGMWNAMEYIPILIQSSICVGSVPEQFPDIRWIPVDIAANMILRMCLDQPPPASSCAYWHLEGSYSILWSNLVDCVVKRADDRIRPTTTRAWLDLVQTLSVDNSRPSVPAAKLLSFYSGYSSGPLAILDTANTKRVFGDLEDIGDVVLAALPKYVDFVFSKF